MSNEHNFRGKRMREAMDQAGLTSGQVAYRMNVSDGTVRGWTTGRRGIGPDELSKFAKVVGYPVDYFMNSDNQLPYDFPMRLEIKKLQEQVSNLLEKVDKDPGYCISIEEDIFEHIHKRYNLSDEAIEAIRQIIKQNQA